MGAMEAEMNTLQDIDTIAFSSITADDCQGWITVLLPECAHAIHETVSYKKNHEQQPITSDVWCNNKQCIMILLST